MSQFQVNVQAFGRKRGRRVPLLEAPTSCPSVGWLFEGDFSFYDRADEAAHKALALDGNNISARVLHAQVLCANHRFHEGLALGRQIYKRNPAEASVLFLIGDAHLELGDYEQADKAYKAEHFSQAADLYQQLQANFPTSDKHDLYQVMQGLSVLRKLDSTKPPFRRKLPPAQQPRLPRTLLRPTASVRPYWPRASCSRTLQPVRPGKLHSDSFYEENRH